MKTEIKIGVFGILLKYKSVLFFFFFNQLSEGTFQGLFTLYRFSCPKFLVIFSPQLKTDSEKRSTTDETWDTTEELKKPEEDLDSHGDGTGKWKGVSSGLPEDPEKTAQKASLSISQTGSWRRGMSAQGGASSRQKAGTSALKTPGRLVTSQLLCKNVLIYGFHSIFVHVNTSFIFN